MTLIHDGKKIFEEYLVFEENFKCIF